MILLDTHALVWLTEGSPDLGRGTRQFIDKSLRIGTAVGISAVSFWEVAMLQARKRLGLKQPIFSWRERILEAGIVEIPVTGETGIAAVEIQNLPGDPADRMIVATAKLERAVLVTADSAILGWNDPLSRLDARL